MPNYSFKIIFEASNLNLIVTCLHEFRKFLFSFKDGAKCLFFFFFLVIVLDTFFDIYRKILPCFKIKEEENVKKEIGRFEIRENMLRTAQLT